MNFLIKVAMVVMQELLMNGSIKTISLMRLVLHIKHLVMIMVLDVMPKLNARTVFLEEVAGLKKELKFTQLINLMM